MRSQFSSSLTVPARPGAADWSVSLQRNAALREPPRPGSCAVRGMPMMLRLYFAAGMPAAPIRSISRQIESSLALPLRVLAQQDMRALRLLDRTRRQRQLHHVERQPELLHVLALAVQIVEAPVVRIARRIDADMGDAELRPDAIVAVVARPDLGSEIHRNLPKWVRCRLSPRDAAKPINPPPHARVAPAPIAARSCRRRRCAASTARSARRPA